MPRNPIGFVAPSIGADERGQNETKGEGHLHKGPGHQPPRGEPRRCGGYCLWCWLGGQQEAQCWFKQKYMRNQGTTERDPMQRDILEWRQEEGNGSMEWDRKRKTDRVSKERGRAKGKMSDQDTTRVRNNLGMQRQRVSGVGEQTRDDQALIFAITDTKPTISDLDMRTSTLHTSN